MIEKLNKNAKVEKFTNMLGIAVRLIVIYPLSCKYYKKIYTVVCENMCKNNFSERVFIFALSKFLPYPLCRPILDARSLKLRCFCDFLDCKGVETTPL